MKYVQNCVATVLTCMVILFFVLSSTASIANTRASADGFLKQLLGAEHYGMGGSFVGATRGANALGSNPAGIGETEGNRFVIHIARVVSSLPVSRTLLPCFPNRT